MENKHSALGLLDKRSKMKWLQSQAIDGQDTAKPPCCPLTPGLFLETVMVTGSAPPLPCSEGTLEHFPLPHFPIAQQEVWPGAPALRQGSRTVRARTAHCLSR